MKLGEYGTSLKRIKSRYDFIFRTKHTLLDFVPGPAIQVQLAFDKMEG
jgi:hypothetical protein